MVDMRFLDLSSNAEQILKEKIKSATIEPEVWDIDRMIKIVPSGIRTIKDYEEHLLHTTGATKIMELLHKVFPLLNKRYSLQLESLAL